MSQRRIVSVFGRLALVLPLLLVLLAVPAAATTGGILPTTTIVTTSPGSAGWHQPVTFSALVFVAGVTLPTGTVQFTVDGVNFGSPVTIVGITATLTTSALSKGTHSIGATYSGDANCFPSAAVPINQYVAGPMVLKVLADKDIIPAGWVIHYTIRVTNDTGAPVKVEVVDTLPGGIKFVSADGGARTKAGYVYWQLSLADGATRNLHVSVRPLTTLRGTIVNKARATWGPNASVSATKLVTVIAP